MKKVLILYLLTSAIIPPLMAQEGALFQSHFKESRAIEDQSWAICQNEHNVMMFANRRGIMTFDGVNWDFIRMPAVPYSIKYSKATRKVYAGCDSNYGLIEKDERGLYHYMSLSGDTSQTGLVANILFTDSTVFFYSEYEISRHNLLTGELERRFTADDGMPFRGIVITPKNVFINVLSKGLFRIEADTLFPIVTGYLFENEEILFSLPYDNTHVLLGFSSGSLSLFDGIKLYNYNILDGGYIKQNVLLDGVSLSDSIYAFSTLGGGAVVVESKSRKVISTVNYENGLPDDEVFAMASDNKSGLWLSHEFGLTRADLRIPIGNFNIYPGLKGNLINAAMHNSELYVSTSEGVYYLSEVKNYSDVMVRVKRDDVATVVKPPEPGTSQVQEDQAAGKTRKGLFSRVFGRKETSDRAGRTDEESQKQAITGQQAASELPQPQYESKKISRLKSINYVYKKVDGLDAKCKQLLSTPDGLLVSTNNGLYVISDHRARVIVKDRYINFIDEKSGDNRYLVAANDGYFYVTAKAGKWSAIFPDIGFRQPLLSVTTGPDGSLWAGGNSVLYRVPDRDGIKATDYRTYSVVNSFPQKYIVETINDTLFLLTESGLYFYEQNNDSFVTYGSETNDVQRFRFIYSQPDIIWYKDDGNWRFLSDEIDVAENRTFLLNIFDDISAICVTGNYIWIITGENLLYRFIRDRELSISPDTELYVKSVTNQDGFNFEHSDIVFRRGDNTVNFDLVAPGYLKQNSIQYQYILEDVMTDWSKWSYSTTITLMPPPGDHILNVRAKDIWGNVSDPRALAFTIKAPFTKTPAFYVSIFIAVVAMIIIIARVRVKQLKKDKQILEEKVQERTKEILAQKEEITSSIEYASRIQMAMLPVKDLFENNFSEHFILFKPRDIVSGDFYWIGENDRQIFFTVADCTGHGVPGAFMSMLGMSILHEIITDRSDLSAASVLSLMRQKVKTSLHQTGKEGEAADGMDIAFCVLDKNRKKLEFAGAYNPLIIFQKDGIREYKGDRMPIGIYYGEKEAFTNHMIKISKGDTVYIFSDGLCDQFGGDNGTKYKIANFKRLLMDINMKPMSEQRTIIEKEFYKWKGSHEQVDDIAIIGVRI